MDIEKYLSHPGIFRYQLISTDRIPFSRSVREACEQNTCGKYGKSWACPPGVGTPEALEARIRSYPFAAVFTCKYDLDDPFDYEGMQNGHQATRKTLAEVTAALQAKETGFLPLGNGYCSLCETCTYPSAPCRFPDKVTPSIEACGINVMQMAKDIGLQYNNGPDTVTYFCMILYR